MGELKKKYGLLTAICMVVGIVIGSGVFFKAEKILKVTGGELKTAILAWVIGGLIMVVCAYAFSIMATKYQKVNGVVDYAEATLGHNYAYLVGWFMTTIYYPTLTTALAWLSARYFGALFQWEATGVEVMTLAGAFLIASYAVNALSPKVAGYFQVGSTIIKLIPLFLMAIVGVIVGLSKGTLITNFSEIPSLFDLKGIFGEEYSVVASPLFAAVCATSFAYEGWIIATSINAELKDAKKNLPKALVGGTIAVVVIYVLYYLGISGSIPTLDLLAHDATYAFTSTFGNIMGVILTLFITVSCLGTLNGLMLGCTRGAYSIAVRNKGIAPETFSQVDVKTNMPTNSSILGLLLCAAWLVYFYGSNLVGDVWFGPFKFDPTELPIITIYALYIPIFIGFMIKEKDFNVFKRIIVPGVAIIGSVFMMIACVKSHGIENVGMYLIVFAVFMVVGCFFMKDKKASAK